jgi:hypothetical protein
VTESLTIRPKRRIDPAERKTVRECAIEKGELKGRHSNAGMFTEERVLTRAVTNVQSHRSILIVERYKEHASAATQIVKLLHNCRFTLKSHFGLHWLRFEGQIAIIF